MKRADVALPRLPDRYVGLRRIGSGGSAEVVLVEDRSLAPSPKAMKIVRSDVHPALIASFREEFRILASLEHPGLARVYEFGELGDGRAYYTVDFVAGRELGADGQVSMRDACRAIASVCRALAYLHARGWIHNDVTPANILIGDSPDSARLLDFGLAGAAQGRSRTVAGTPGYIAPERLDGAPSDHRADLYSVGATLYRVLGGRRVTEQERPTRALEELRTSRTPFAELRPDLPEGLGALIEACLSIEPSGRPAHAFEIIASLSTILGEVLPLETPGAARCYALSSLLVGREAELADLEQGARDAATLRMPRILLASARDGMGKTRVMRELATRLETAGFRVARVRCRAGALIDPLAEIAAQLELGTSGQALPKATDDLGASIIAAASDPRTTLIILDDAHEASDAVWALIQSIVERAAAGHIPIAIALAMDPDAAAASAKQRLALAAAQGWLVRVELSALPRTHLRRMLVSLFGEGVIPEAMQSAIAERSGGVPLLLEEIVRDLVESGAIMSGQSGWSVAESASVDGSLGSERLEDFLRRRCARLPADARGLLAALATLGGHGTFADIAAVLPAPIDVPMALSALADQGLVAATSTEIALLHRLAGSVVLAGLDPEQRKAHFARAAARLEVRAADDVVLARAYREAGDVVKAFDRALSAGLRARDAGEGRLAARALEEALAIADEAGASTSSVVDALRAAAEAYRSLGRPADALRMLGRAFTRAPANAQEIRARIAARAVREAIFASDMPAAEQWLARAEAAVPPGDAVALAMYEVAAATLAVVTGRPRLARARFAAALAALEGSPETTELLSLRVGILHSSVAGHQLASLPDARRAAEEACAVAERLGNRYLLGMAQNNLVHMMFEQGEIRAAKALAERLLPEAERAGNAALCEVVLVNLAEATHALGDWDGARKHVARARAIAETTGGFQAIVVGVLGLLAWEEGDFAAAGRDASRAVEQRPPLLAAQAFDLLFPIAASAADRGDSLEARRVVARAAPLMRDDPGAVAEAHFALLEAYAVAAENPRDGGLRLAETATLLQERGAHAYVPLILRDAASFSARAGELATMRTSLRRARQLLAERGSAPAMLRLDEVESGRGSSAESTLPPRLGEARSFDELARGLRAVARAAGMREVHLFSLVDGVVRESGASVDVQPTLVRAIRTAIGGDSTSRVGDLVLHSVRSGAFEACIATGKSEHAGNVALLHAAAESGLAALAARAARPAAAGEPSTRAKTSADDSRLLELTVGPMQLRSRFGGVVGKSAAMTRAFALLARLADSDAPVLLTGETGTGKEIFARALHDASKRSSAPFVTVNCAALPAPLFEAELFGFRRGAFTGAVRDQIGHARLADGGTLFLDEVGELPLELQPKLLRLLQERSVTPLGGGTEKKVDLRIVAATNRDLEADVASGRFRPDLYYRLDVVELHLPPLRERATDIPELVTHLLTQLGKKEQPTKRALARLCAYAWPGNVRELANELERAGVLAGSRPIDERHLSPRLRKSSAVMPVQTTGTLAERVAGFERIVVAEVLEKCGANRTRAAKVLGLTRQGLLLKLRRLGITKAKV